MNSGQYELERQRPQQRNQDMESFRERTSYRGGSVVPSREPENNTAKPNINIPENLQPSNIFEVTMDKAKWLENLAKINKDPFKFQAEPEVIGANINLTANDKLEVTINTMGANFQKTGEATKWPLKLLVGLESTDGSGGDMTWIPKTTESANRQAIIRHLVVIMGEQMGWRQISETNFMNIITKQYESSGNHVVTIKDNLSRIELQFGDIPNSELETKLEEIRRFIEIAGDLSLQILTPDTKNKQLLDLPYPLAIDRRFWYGKPKNNRGVDTGEEHLVSGFNVENNRAEVAGYSLEDMGGNPEVKREIELLIKLFQYQDHFRRYGVKPPRGVLLEGPPGTGKTLAARIIASSLGIAFYEFSSADLKSVWLGESPKIVRSAFREAETPCVFFFDEFDVVASKRSESSESHKEIVQEILRGMDGLKSRSDIIIIAATNNAEQLDEAVRRVGRFDKKIHVGHPDKTARSEIFKVHYKNAIEGAEQGLPIFSGEFNDLIFSQLADITDGFSGAEIAEVFRRAVLEVGVSALENPDFTLSHNDLSAIIDQIKKEKIDNARTRREAQEQLGFKIPKTKSRE